VLVLLVVAACIAAVSRSLPHNISSGGGPNLDEVAYDAQAALADGHLTLPAATHDPFFRPSSRSVTIAPSSSTSRSGPLDRHVARRARLDASVRALLAAAESSRRTRSLRSLDRRRVAHHRRNRGGLAVHVDPVGNALGYQLSSCSVSPPRRDRAPLRPNGLGRGRRGSAPRLRGVPSAVDALLAALPVLYAALDCRQRSARPPGRPESPARCRRRCARGVQHDRDGRAWKLPFGVSGPIDRFGSGGGAVRRPGKRSRGACTTRSGVLGGMWTARASPVSWSRHRSCCCSRSSSSSGNDATHAWLLVGMIATLIVGYLSWWGVVNAVEFDLTLLGPFYHYLALGPLAVLAAGACPSAVDDGDDRRSRRTRDRADGTGDLDRAARCTRCRTSAPPRLRSRMRRGLASCSRIRCSPAIPMCASRTTAPSGRRAVGIDIPGHRLDAVERSDRAAYLVRGFHRAGDIVGPIQRDSRFHSKSSTAIGCR
jgi:hypothetical protein